MKRMMAIAALMSLPALAACGRQSGDANVTAGDINRLGTVEQNGMAEPQNLTVDGAGNTAAEPEPGVPAPAERNAVEPPQKTSPTTRPERPAQRPRPPSPPVDPHAGHDMGNMANMQH